MSLTDRLRQNSYAMLMRLEHFLTLLVIVGWPPPWPSSAEVTSHTSVPAGFLENNEFNETTNEGKILMRFV